MNDVELAASEDRETGVVDEGSGDCEGDEEDEADEADEKTEDAVGIASKLVENAPEDEGTGTKSVELVASSSDDDSEDDSVS